MIAFERLDAVSSVVLHPLENNQPITGRFYFRIHHLEVARELVLRELVFQQPLDRLF